MYELSHFNSYIDKNMQVQNLELSIERLKRINENVAMDIASENENHAGWWNNSRSVYSNNADMNTA